MAPAAVSHRSSRGPPCPYPRSGGRNAARSTGVFVQARASRAVNQALASSALKAAMAQDGALSAGGSGADFSRFMSEELKFWGEVVRKSGAKAE